MPQRLKQWLLWVLSFAACLFLIWVFQRAGSIGFRMTFVAPLSVVVALAAMLYYFDAIFGRVLRDPTMPRLPLIPEDKAGLVVKLWLCLACAGFAYPYAYVRLAMSVSWPFLLMLVAVQSWFNAWVILVLFRQSGLVKPFGSQRSARLVYYGLWGFLMLVQSSGVYLMRVHH